MGFGAIFGGYDLNGCAGDRAAGPKFIIKLHVYDNLRVFQAMSPYAVCVFRALFSITHHCLH